MHHRKRGRFYFKVVKCCVSGIWQALSAGNALEVTSNWERRDYTGNVIRLIEATYLEIRKKE